MNVKHKKALEQLHFTEAQNRARSITVGTCFGGTIEVGMRRLDGTPTYAIMQPVEVVELIHQLAANVGCHIQLTPRRDFASWRQWDYTEEELAKGGGHAPHPNNLNPHRQRAAILPPPDEQLGMPNTLGENKDGEALATETPKQRRKSKRATASS